MPHRFPADLHVANKLTWGFSKNLLKIWPALWTFVEVEGVEPTNNRAELFAYLAEVLGARVRGDPAPLLA